MTTLSTELVLPDVVLSGAQMQRLLLRLEAMPRTCDWEMEGGPDPFTDDVLNELLGMLPSSLLDRLNELFEQWVNRECPCSYCRPVVDVIADIGDAEGGK